MNDNGVVRDNGVGDLAVVRTFAAAFPQQFARAVNGRHRALLSRDRRRVMRLAADRGLPLGVVARVLASSPTNRVQTLLDGGSRYMLEWLAGADQPGDPGQAEAARLILSVVDAEPTEPPIDVGDLLALLGDVEAVSTTIPLDRSADDAPPGWIASRAPDAPRGPTSTPTTACQTWRDLVGRAA